jgi:epoxyqueuosine reductase QueG
VIRNACIAAGNIAAQFPSSAPERLQLQQRLRELAQSSDPLIAEHAGWALTRFA